MFKGTGPWWDGYIFKDSSELRPGDVVYPGPETILNIGRAGTHSFRVTTDATEWTIGDRYPQVLCTNRP